MSSKQKTRKVSILEEVKILRNIVEITNSDLNLEGILDGVVRIITEMTKADAVFIYLFDIQHKHLVLLATKTPHKKELGKVNLKIGEGIAGWVVDKNEVVTIEENAYKDPRFKAIDELPEDMYESIFSVPVTFEEKPIGVVNIQHKEKHSYEDDIAGMITLITKQISGVIHRALLYEETKVKARQFDSIIQVSKSVTSKNYLDEILNFIVIVTAKMLNSKICSVMILDKNKETLEIVSTQSLSQEYKGKPNVSISKSVSGKAILKKEPIVVYNVQEEKDFMFKEMATNEKLTSMVVVPMVIKDEAIGVINVYTKKPYKFNQEEINVLQIIANQAATAIENTKLVEEALKSKEALETRKIVDRAKRALMNRNNLSEDVAYRIIHKKSMDTCRPMKDIAEAILLVEDLSE